MEVNAWQIFVDAYGRSFIKAYTRELKIKLTPEQFDQVFEQVTAKLNTAQLPNSIDLSDLGLKPRQIAVLARGAGEQVAEVDSETLFEQETPARQEDPVALGTAIADAIHSLSRRRRDAHARLGGIGPGYAPAVDSLIRGEFFRDRRRYSE